MPVDDKIIYTGVVRRENDIARLHIFHRKMFDKDIDRLAGKNVEITIRLKRKRRSLMQNAYYWGVVVPLVREGLRDAGWQFTIEETHELMKAKHLKIEKVNEDTGEIIRSIGSTTDLTTTGMMDYIAAIQQWAAEFIGVTIPDPNEQLMIEI